PQLFSLHLPDALPISRSPKLHHHVALDCDGEFAKVARFLTGRAIGLVLAGGGALGCAHLGVVQALQDARIPIDFIGGTSAGAAIDRKSTRLNSSHVES